MVTSGPSLGTSFILTTAVAGALIGAVAVHSLIFATSDPEQEWYAINVLRVWDEDITEGILKDELLCETIV